jgi:hypothetical protein
MNRTGRLRQLGRYDWDAIAGVVAAAAALILHLLHVVNTEVLLSIALVVLALLLIRDLRREGREERIEAASERAEHAVLALRAAVTPPDAVLVGPRHLRSASAAFARRARGEMVWFNVCLSMFRPQSLFDALLRPALENPMVTALQFTLDVGERDRWSDDVWPKIMACNGHEKVRQPKWCALHESVSFVLADIDADGRAEAQLSFWGEPFMARATARDIPRYIFHVQGHSELIPRLIEIERSYRTSSLDEALTSS